MKFCISSLVLVSLLVCSVPVALGLSNGLLPECDMGYAVGWGSNFMYWSHTPYPDNIFKPDIPALFNVTVPLLNGRANEYVPGQLTPITITTLSTYWRHLGIMMYAMNTDPGITGTGTYPWTTHASEVSYQVGTWTVSANSGYQTLFNGQCVTHANSELKPLQSTFWVNLPASSTPIYIRVVFKIGEQNNGWMVYPTLLKLQQGFSTTSTGSANSVIAIAPPGTNCHQTCTYNFPTTYPNCDAATSSSITSLETLEILVPGGVSSCKPGATIQTCDSNNPMINDTAGGLCSFNSYSCASSTLAFDCEAVDNDNHKICSCMTGSSESGYPTSTPTSTSSVLPGSSTVGSTTHSSSVASSASSFPTVPVAVSVSIGSVAIFGLFIAYGLYRRQQFANTSKMTSDISNTPMMQQVARPVMPEGRI